MLGVRRWGVALLIGVLSCEGESRSSRSEAAADGARAASSSNAGSPDALGAAAGAPAAGTAGAETTSVGGMSNGGISGGGTTANAPGGSGAAGQASAPVPIEQVSAALAEAYCTIAQRCEQGMSTNGFVMPGEDCVLLTQKRLELNGLELLAAAVSAGRIEYHPELMQACLDAITAQACQDTTERDLPACEAAITGRAALGEPCKLSEECQGSLLCDTRVSCPGTCAARYVEDVHCTVDAECADGLGCEMTPSRCTVPPEPAPPSPADNRGGQRLVIR